jgi:N-acetylglucosaminyldiphosphoundecaprenol N-acetyl-beta-D-mannosaminyltransferase
MIPAKTTENILSYNVINSSLTSCIESILYHILHSNSPAFKYLVCLNPHSYRVAKSDEIFNISLLNADWVIPDGVGILIASKILNGKIKERITGFDIFCNVMKHANENNLSIFLLGSTSDTLKTICAKIKIDYPNAIVAGTYSPPFKDKFSKSDTDIMVSCINKSNARILFVSLSAPKQEKLIYNILQNVNVSFGAAIGAVFDFYSGNIKRSHPIFQRFGLEWLPRLLQEPKRLWKRTIFSAPFFLFHVFLQYKKKNI